MRVNIFSTPTQTHVANKQDAGCVDYLQNTKGKTVVQWSDDSGVWSVGATWWTY